VRAAVRAISGGRRTCEQRLELGAFARRRHTPARLVAEHLRATPRTKSVVEHLDRAEGHQRRVHVTTRAADLQQLMAQLRDVCRTSHTFQVGVEPAHQPLRVRRHSGRAPPGVAALGLDAADREHRLAPDVHRVTPEREREQCGVGKAELAGTHEHDIVGDALLGKRAVDAREPDLERQRDMIGECKRSGPRATFAAVDRDEVDPPLASSHEPGEVAEERGVTDRRLDADRPTRHLGELLHEVEHAVGVVKRGVRRGADAVDPYWDATDLGDLLGHLGAG